MTFSHCSGLMTILDEFKLYVQLILAYKSQYIVAPSIQKTGFEFFNKTLIIKHKKFPVHLSVFRNFLPGSSTYQKKPSVDIRCMIMTLVMIFLILLILIIMGMISLEAKILEMISSGVFL